MLLGIEKHRIPMNKMPFMYMNRKHRSVFSAMFITSLCFFSTNLRAEPSDMLLPTLSWLSGPMLEACAKAPSESLKDSCATSILDAITKIAAAENAKQGQEAKRRPKSIFECIGGKAWQGKEKECMGFSENAP